MKMKKSLFKQIYKEHKKQLKNLSKVNGRLIICFVGIPGSGKTYLAKKLEKRYKGVRIKNDELRKIISNKFEKNEKKREKILEEYILDLLENPPFANRLVILDSGLERKYKKIYDISKSKKWDMFIIKMVAPKTTIIERIRIKDEKRLKEHPEDIKRWFREYKDFNKKVKVNFVFRKDSDLEGLFLGLNGVLER